MHEESQVDEETEERSYGGVQPPTADRSVRSSAAAYSKARVPSEPLFQLSIKLSHDEEPEILKFYEGQDPRSLALELRDKYPNHIVNEKMLDLVEMQIRQGWNAVMVQEE